MSQTPPKLHVSFLVFADVLDKNHPTLDQVTTAAGVTPAEAFINDGVFVWRYNYADGVDGWDVAILISEMLNTLDLKTMKETLSGFYQEIKVTAYITQETGSPDLCLPAGLIHQIAEAGASLDLDIISITNAPKQATK